MVTQTQIAENIGITSSYLNQIINGYKVPRWEVAKRIATATNTEPLLWLEGSSEERKAVIENLKQEGKAA